MQIYYQQKYLFELFSRGTKFTFTLGNENRKKVFFGNFAELANDNEVKLTFELSKLSNFTA